jgi:hypothetical protein
MRYTTILLFLSLTALVNAQNKSLQVGLKMTHELTFYSGYAPGFGGQVVYRMGKHGGLESGIIYQARPQKITIVYKIGANTYAYNARIRESRLQMPILYRYDAKTFNFVIGPVVDYFMGWKEKSDNPNVSINSYNRHSVNFAMTGGISKSFYLAKDIILEPEARAAYILNDNDGGIGLNLSLRKIL